MSYDNGNGFVVVKSSDKTGLALLADRTNQRKRWWVRGLKGAMIFHSEYAANQACDKLKYGNARVQTVDEFKMDAGY